MLLYTSIMLMCINSIRSHVREKQYYILKAESNYLKRKVLHVVSDNKKNQELFVIFMLKLISIFQMAKLGTEQHARPKQITGINVGDIEDVSRFHYDILNFFFQLNAINMQPYFNQETEELNKYLHELKQAKSFLTSAKWSKLTAGLASHLINNLIIIKMRTNVLIKLLNRAVS